MNWLPAIVIYGGGLTCIALAVRTLVRAWRAPAPIDHIETKAEHWGRVHREGDRRAPYSELRHSDRWSGANFKLRRRA